MKLHLFRSWVWYGTSYWYLYQEKVNKLRTCVDYDSCDCKQLFGPDKSTWSVSSKATKQLAITRCPKVSTIEIHLLKTFME
jgi:ubiquitin carboxyl-terminal hydrolase 30